MQKEEEEEKEEKKGAEKCRNEDKSVSKCAVADG